MNNSGQVQIGSESGLVTFKFLVDGEEIPSVKSIVVEKGINKIPYAQILVLDGSVNEQEFELSNKDLLVPGKQVEITSGYYSEEETIFKGIIVKHRIKVRDNLSYIILDCKDEVVKMTLGRKSAFFYDSSDSDVIETLLSNNGFSGSVESTNTTHKELVQYRASDWDFMLTRAQANGKLCFIDDGEITIAKPDFNSTAIETITYGSSIHEFEGEIDARDQFNTVTSSAWNPTDQELIEAESQDPGVNLNSDLSSSELADVFQIEKLEQKHGGNLTQDELQDWSNAKLLYQQLAKTRGHVKFQGIAKVKPNTCLNLEGVGNRFNGKIYVSSVRHEIADGNWLVDAQFGLSPQWFSEVYDVTEMPGSGIIPAISGLHIGVVTQLESDPDGEDRILVQIPIINTEEQGIWARVATLDAGENRGTFFRPEIEDEVIIGFINDDPNDAVVLGMLHSSAKPAPLTAEDDNHEKGLVTRSEMKMIFNDDKISYVLETPAGKKVTLDEDAGILQLEDEHSNIMTFNDSGITIESAGDITIKATGDVNMEGMNVNIKANSALKAEGGSGAEVSSGANTVIKGSLVQIN